MKHAALHTKIFVVYSILLVLVLSQSIQVFNLRCAPQDPLTYSRNLETLIEPEINFIKSHKSFEKAGIISN